MSMATLPVRLVGLGSQAILLPEKWLREHAWKDGQKVTLSFGSRSITANVYPNPSQSSYLGISADAAKRLLLVPGEYHLQAEGNRLKLGPVIGILTSSGVQQKMVLLRAGKHQGALVYVFHPTGINWKQRVITGHCLAQDGKTLQYRKFPFPDVVYERIPNRVEQRHYQHVLRRFYQDPQVQIFNQGYYDKWNIYQRLVTFPQLRDHLPESRLALAVHVRDLLNRYGEVFLKPIHGSLGLGIVHIIQRGNRLYAHYNTPGGRSQRQSFHSISQLLGQLIPQKSRLYMVQQGIRLIRYHGSAVDFRSHMHKNDKGAWVLAALSAKVAGRGSVTTHARTGGKFKSPSQVLKQVFGDEQKVQSILRELERVSQEVCQCIELEEKGPIGELGLDLGVDVHGRVWLFEVNSKPGRHVFAVPWMRRQGWRSALYLVDFAKLLSGFVPRASVVQEGMKV